jgi:anti-anti-sigma regulatory factor
MDEDTPRGPAPHPGVSPRPGGGADTLSDMHDDTPFSSRRSDDGVLVLAGSIDEEFAPQLLTLLLDALAEEPLVVDLSEVDYLPSVALSAFVSAWHADGANPMTLQARTGTIAQRVLSVTALPHTQLPA